MAQTRRVGSLLAAHHADLAEDGAIELVRIQTTGDKIQDRTLADIGGKELFTKEIEEALIAGRIDLAVHSLKDVPTFLPPHLCISCVIERDDPRDAWLSRNGARINELGHGAVVGTASLRRQAQLLSLRPDLNVQPIRGNAGTRMRKLAQGDVEATLLAISGLHRLGEGHVATEVLDTDTMLPAVAQGAIGIECRTDDKRTRDYLEPLEHRPSRLTTDAERAFLAALDGSCHTPIAALAELHAETSMRLRGLVAKPDGSQVWRVERIGERGEAALLGTHAGEELAGSVGPVLASLRV